MKSAPTKADRPTAVPSQSHVTPRAPVAPKPADAQTFIMNTYARYPVHLASGKGCRLTDTAGKTYLDMLSGIASCPLGHGHPAFVESVRRHAQGLTNASNLYYTDNQARLASELCRITSMEKCFFSNSGSESNEAALKLAMAATGKKRFIACKGAFHGRTMGSLSATYDAKYRTAFEPLSPAVDFVDYGSADAIKAALTPQTAAVIVEPIQGEAGVITPPADYLAEVLELCESNDVLLIVDEVQSGNGRTGTYFEYQSHGMRPHIVTTAKGLANGLPMGATMARSLDFKPGQHGTTFGGNSFVAGVAYDVVRTIQDEGLMKNAARQGKRIMDGVRDMRKKTVSGIRGKGLMVGIQLDGNAKPALEALRQNGVLANVAHENTLRLLPALILKKSETDEFLQAFNEVVA